MAKRTHSYIKLKDDMSVEYCPRNDVDGSVTGHIVYEVAAWFDENPEERKKLGWIKMIYADRDEVEYDNQTQYLVRATEQVDEWTIREVFYPLDKSEEMMLLEDMLESLGYSNGESLLHWAGFEEGEI